MDPWDEQDRRDHTIDPSSVQADDEDRAVTTAAWSSLVLGVIAVVLALTSVRFLSADYPELRTGLTMAAFAAFALVGSAILAICSVIKAAELRIRRDR